MGEDARLVHQVRDALACLHDRSRLQVHPLLARMPPGAGGRALQAALEDAIGALRPPPGTSATARAARIHRLLHMRYVEGAEPRTIWTTLGVGKSQYFRDHGRGVAAVASVFQERLGAAHAPHADAAARDGRPRGNLPPELSTFVGREAETAAVARLLGHPEGARRLVTLTGAGGVGKTRLALRAAAGAASGFPDGAWFVDLARAASDADVAAATAAALALTAGAGTARDALLAHLRRRRALLVLDNCEHLVDACAELAEELLRACPDVRILATSREPLRVAGEITWRVPSLPPADAVDLFVERARAIDPAFTQKPASPVVEEICGRLDGIPLALELAAARTRSLPVEEIAARLDERFALLTTGVRTAPPRHHTLRAAIDWSHALLPDEERAVLRRLGVFVGGFALDAAAAVHGAFGPSEADLLERLDSLVAKSLVSPPTGGRFAMLETIRAYALERLAESGEAEAAGRTYADYFLGLAERADPELNGPNQRVWFARLAAEQANLRAALRWYLERRLVEPGLRLAGALQYFWPQHPGEEGARWLAAFLDLPQPSSGGGRGSATRARALATLGWLLHTAQPDAALGHLEEGAALARRLGDERVLAHALALLAVVQAVRGATAAARAAAQESLALSRRLGDTWRVSYAVHVLGVAALWEGDRAAARAAFEEELSIARAVGYPTGAARAMEWLGNVLCEEGHPAAARALYEEARAAFEGAGVAFGEAEARLGLALAVLEDGEQGAATALLKECLAARWERGYGVTMTLAGLAGAAAARLATASDPSAEARRALRLAGAASAARERHPASNEVLLPSWGARVERWLRPARDALGAAAGVAYTEGGAMTVDEAVDYALGTP